jgi:hypothetical protein
MTPRAALRLAPEIPETAPGLSERIRSVEIDRMRATEAEIDRKAAYAEGLSLRLAHLYGRNVVCYGGVPEGNYVRRSRDGTVRMHLGAPPRAVVARGEYVEMQVSYGVAEQLLARDTGADLSGAPLHDAVEPFRMPTLAELLAVEGGEWN